MLSKLQEIRCLLENDPRIEVLGVEENNYLGVYDNGCGCGGWSITVEIIAVARKPIRDGKVFRELVYSLVPTIEPTCKDDYGGDSVRLYYDEKIGTRLRRGEIVISVDAADAAGDRRRVVSLASDDLLMRRIWLIVYASRAQAEGSASRK